MTVPFAAANIGVPGSRLMSIPLWNLLVLVNGSLLLPKLEVILPLAGHEKTIQARHRRGGISSFQALWQS